MQREEAMEQRLIQQLINGESQWNLREDLKTEAQLWDNFFKILQTNNLKALNDIPLTDNEKSTIKSKITHATFFRSATDFVGANGKYSVHISRDDVTLGDLTLLVVDHNDIAGGTSVYEVVHQIQLGKRKELDNDRRGDVTLLINGLPVIHIELKTPDNSPMQAFNQIQKYIREQKFNGIFSTLQMFVITNGTETQYIAADQQLRAKFLSGWVDNENAPVHDYLSFAKDVLSIPMAHKMVAEYSVLDSKQKHIILLRPYQIHAIERILEASKYEKSGFIWHTTGSGKTLTSYRVAHNLLTIPRLNKVIFLIDRKDLDNQTTQAFQSYANNDSIDVSETESTVTLAKNLTSDDRTVVVTTRQKLQTLFKWQNEDGNQGTFEKLKNLNLAFIVDECHRTISPETKMEIDKFFNIQPLWYGFTGTPILTQNQRKENGRAARTTQQQYGPCLHSYTIKDAIRDKAVLGFKIKNEGNSYRINDEEDPKVLDPVYITDKHMKEVAKNVLKSAYRNLGLYNINNRGYSYSAIFTTSPAKIRPIEQAKRYYELFRDIKNGVSDVKVPGRIQEVLPDFPKVAITFSVTENDDESIDDQDFMKQAINDYNHEYGTSFSLAEVEAYNRNINDRLARKLDVYKPQSERLDFVIVVDRLLTGFDSQYVSTLYVDRPPMNPQNIIQSFSRTNRIFDADKKFGNIVTYQYPNTFGEAIDNAIALYSNDKLGSMSFVKAPSWEECFDNFKQVAKELKPYLTQDLGEFVQNGSDEEQLAFVKLFQQFDTAFAAVQTYDEFDDINVAEQYGLDNDKLEALKGSYKQLADKFKKTEDVGDENAPIDFDYELESVNNKSINYQYILNLIQAYIPSGEENEPVQTNFEFAEIDNYIADLAKTNKPLATIMANIWQQIKDNPQDYAGQQIDQIWEQAINNVYNQELETFAKTYNVDLDKLQFVVKNFVPGRKKQPGENRLLSRAAFNAFISNNDSTEFNKMLGWKKHVRAQLNDMYDQKIQPLMTDY